MTVVKRTGGHSGTLHTSIIAEVRTVTANGKTIVIAYTVMADIVMANIDMADIVMAYCIIAEVRTVTVSVNGKNSHDRTLACACV